MDNYRFIVHEKHIVFINKSALFYALTVKYSLRSMTIFVELLCSYYCCHYSGSFQGEYSAYIHYSCITVFATFILVKVASMAEDGYEENSFN